MTQTRWLTLLRPLLVAALWLIVGCAGESDPSGDGSLSAVESRPAPAPRRQASPPKPRVAHDPERGTKQPNDPSVGSRGVNPPPRQQRTLADLLKGPQRVERMPIDEKKVASAGIRKIPGKHLVLYTDLPPEQEIDELPQVFDHAVAQWCEYFDLAPATVADWRMTGFLIRKKQTFVDAGLLPDFLPQFQHGFTLGLELWVYDQPTAYYRRHLLLHEGTHSFMQLRLGGAGPPWYAEGMAELLATHRWQDGRLTLNYMPRDKAETPGWGRVKIIRDGFAAKTALPLRQVFAYGPQAHLQVEPYGWCWGAAAFFDRHPRFQQVFADLRSHLRDPPLAFNDALKQPLAGQWSQVAEEWQLFVAEAEYGYDFARAAVIHKPTTALPTIGAQFTVAADRGWQSSGLAVEAGKNYKITASGRYQVGNQPKIWWCEPGGVTIRYYRGRPLGMLVAAVRGDGSSVAGPTPLIAPQPVGLGATLKPANSGTLCFRINESPAHLADNNGELTVRITEIP